MLPSDEGTVNEPKLGSMERDHPQPAKLQLSHMSVVGDVLVLLTPLLFIGEHSLILGVQIASNILQHLQLQQLC